MNRLATIARRGLVVLALASWPALAGAVETPEFAVEPVANPGGGLEVDLDRNGRGRAQVEVRNKLAEELVVQFAVVPAQVSPEGKPSLGGDAAPAAWVKAPGTLRLAPQSRQQVRVAVQRPKDASLNLVATAALTVQRVVADPASAAVIQQSALVIYMRPSKQAPTVAGLPPLIAALAALALLGSGGWAGVYAARQRSRKAQSDPG